MMDGMGMMVWSILSFLFGLLVLFLFILAVAYGVKRVWANDPQTSRGKKALWICSRSVMQGAKSAEKSSNVSKETSSSSAEWEDLTLRATLRIGKFHQGKQQPLTR